MNGGEIMLDTYELFVNSSDLPGKLTKEELYELLGKMQKGSLKARDEIIVHNVRLVLYVVGERFKSFTYLKKDLVASGNIGLIKAVDTYDMSRGVEFSIYAFRCINNEILQFLKSQRKHEQVDSINKVFFDKDEGRELMIIDVLASCVDLVGDYEKAEVYRIIRQLVDELPKAYRMSTLLYFGFLNGRAYSQKEIASMLQVSQSYVSRLVKQGIKIIGNQLECLDVISINPSFFEKTKNSYCGAKTFFELLDGYSHDEVMSILSDLSCDEVDLIRFRFGDDLNKPASRSFTEEQRSKFYNYLIPKLKRELNKKRKNNQHLKVLKK